jgi:putative glutathione S-transferase
MGMLVDGQWQDQEVRRTNAEGAFVRNESPYRDVIGSKRFPVEADRYHLFVNAGCPWAYRTILYRSIKNLQPYLTMSYTLPAAGQQGWTFGEAGEPLLNAMHMHDVYTQANDNFTGRCTVPVLWDKNSHTIVNNESADIIRMFDSAFDDQQGVSPTRYYLTEHATEIDALNDEIYTTINNGVYRCGFSQSQAAYDEAFDLLFASLDQLDKRLAGHRELCGAPITEADWRLFATLVRFDVAYYGQFKCNLHRIVDYPNLWPYMRDLYQQPGVAETVDITAIKGIYYGSRAPGILPKGPALDFAEPHGRASLR